MADATLGDGTTASPLAQAVRAQLIAKYPQLDPSAVMAVGSQEGLSGGIGDGGHAFGPFQLNNAGGVITGKFAGMSPQQIQAWATSPAGIDYALSGINKVAGGLKGSAAINAIVSKFERPANIPGEIAGAIKALGSGSSVLGSSSSSLGSSPVLAQQTASPSGASMAANRQAILSLLQANSQALMSGQLPAPSNVLAALQEVQQAQTAQTPSSGSQDGTEPTRSTQGAAAATSSDVVQAAHGFLGIPYKYGGNDPKTGLDCSSFVQQTYAKVGVQLPRTTTQQIAQGHAVPLHELQPGDVVFTEPGKGPSGGPGHEGLYIGNDQIQESPHTGTVNSIVSLNDFLGGGFVGARRYT